MCNIVYSPFQPHNRPAKMLLNGYPFPPRFCLNTIMQLPISFLFIQETTPWKWLEQSATRGVLQCRKQWKIDWCSNCRCRCVEHADRGLLTAEFDSFDNLPRSGWLHLLNRPLVAACGENDFDSLESKSFLTSSRGSSPTRMNQYLQTRLITQEINMCGSISTQPGLENRHSETPLPYQNGFIPIITVVSCKR